MIHPDTEIKRVSKNIGSGVFSTAFIPRGTIIVAKDPFDTILSREVFQALPSILRDKLETYLYHDKHGRLFLSWDHAKYMNHSCSSNTLMTDYEFEIAIRDISCGEEITTEYGLLNVQDPYPLTCGCTNCREHLQRDDIDKYSHIWDAQMDTAIRCIPFVKQPLWPLVQEDIKKTIVELIKNNTPTRSVRNLQWQPKT